MALRPGLAALQAMTEAAASLPSFDGGDAGFLNAFVLGPAGCGGSGGGGGGGGDDDSGTAAAAAAAVMAASQHAQSGAAAAVGMGGWVELPPRYNFTSHRVRAGRD
jgi:hypothetical protein